jgi:hypothetical protein
MSDVRLEPSGYSILVQPLTGKAKRWLDENADSPEWAWQGGALAVDPRMVPGLVEAMTAAGLEVEGQEPPAAADLILATQREFAKADKDTALVKALDAIQDAEKKGLLSPDSVVLAADALRAKQAGLSILEWQRAVLSRFGKPHEWLSPVIEELKRAGLLPWGEAATGEQEPDRE